MSISFSGLASGFDSAKYIEAIMKQERVPYNKLQTKKSITTAYQNVFNNLKSQLSTLKDAATALRDVSSFTVNSATVSDATKMTVTAGETAIAGNYAVNVVSLAKQDVYQSKAINNNTSVSDFVGEKIQLKISDSDIVEFELEGTNIDEVLSNLAREINKHSKSGVSASIIQTSSTEKRLVLTSKETGEDYEINFMTPFADLNNLTEEDKKSFLDSTGNHPVIMISDQLKSALGFDSVEAHVQEAKNAELKINGVLVSSASNTVRDAIPGVTMEVTAQGESTVKVSQDTDKIIGKVETFVKAYNSIITTIRDNTAKSVKNSDGSLSLTLQGDSTLRNLQSELNSWMNSIVGESEGFRLLSDIGLEIDKGITSATLMTGKITFDTEIFKEKLAKDPEALQKMFTSRTDSGDSKDGLGILFENSLKAWTDSVDGYMTSRIDGYSAEIKFVTKQMEDMDIRLTKKQASLQRKFVNMEVVMSGLNSQLDWMKSQLAALTTKSSS